MAAETAQSLLSRLARLAKTSIRRAQTLPDGGPHRCTR